MTASATRDCPKHMRYGPCGGVGFDGSCEVGGLRCSFVDAPPPAWDGIRTPDGERFEVAQRRPAVAAAEAMRARLRAGAAVVVDLPSRPMDSGSLAECAAIVRGAADAALLGDSGRSRVQFPPAYRASLVQACGVPAWAGLNCRDRNRVALEGELAGLVDAGVSAMHCVTGDHTAIGHRPDAQPVFDLDAPQLVALARAAGHLVSVGESPASPPTRWRAERLAVKVAAGAEVCFVNHAGGAEPVADFIGQCRALGLDVAYLACVPMVVDRGSAELLQTFTSLVTPPGFLDRILAADDPYATGIVEVTELCLRMLDVPGVRGVNLSGGPTIGQEVPFAEAQARVASALR